MFRLIGFPASETRVGTAEAVEEIGEARASRRRRREGGARTLECRRVLGTEEAFGDECRPMLRIQPLPLATKRAPSKRAQIVGRLKKSKLNWFL